MDSVSSSFDRLPIAYREEGSGAPAIVFIHGLVGDHADFDAQVEHFAGAHRVVAVDLPGAGGSGRSRSTWTMETLGEDVATVADHLELDDVVLVGHSLGGNVAVEAALRLSGRVRGLVWLNISRSLDPPGDPLQMETWFAPFAVDFPAAMEDLNRRNFGPDADPALVESIAAAAREADEARAMGLLRSKFGHRRAADARALLDAPIIAINSDFKPIDEASFASRDVELRIIQGVGHFVMLEAPDELNSELADALVRLDQATPRNRAT